MVVPEVVETRAAIKFCVNLGHTPTETFNLLKIAGDAPAMKKSTVFKWHARFKQGRKSIEDDSRSGRAKAISDKLVTCVSDVVEKDRRQTVREISETVGSSYGTVRTILHDHLHMNRLCARWVPRLLTAEERERRVAVSKQFLRRNTREGDMFLDRIITCDETWLWLFDPETKQQSTQWTDKESETPKKARVAKSGGKFMFIMFADRQGMLLSHAVPQRVTVNSQYYSKVLRRDLQQAIRKKRPGKAISDFLLHQDNAPPHVSVETRLELSLLELETVPHAPYSPDLAPMDFAVFPEIKSQLRGKRFGDFAELRQAVSSIISNYDKTWYRDIFRRWVDRHQKCVREHGQYFEKL